MFPARLRTAKPKAAKPVIWAHRLRWRRTPQERSTLCGTPARANGGPERIYFSSSTTGGSKLVGAGERVECGRRASSIRFLRWLRGRRAMCASRGWMRGQRRRATQPSAVEYLLPQFHQRRRHLERRDSAFRAGARLRLHSCRRLPLSLSETTSAWRSTAMGATHAVWGEGRNYKSPGSIWYAQGR